jgi:hypothetical protein
VWIAKKETRKKGKQSFCGGGRVGDFFRIKQDGELHLQAMFEGWVIFLFSCRE